MKKTERDITEYLTRAIHISGKRQKLIAKESGFPRANVISMIKSGDMKLPVSRIPALATSLCIDPNGLLNLYMEIYNPDLHALLQALAPSALISAAEFEVIKTLRLAARTGVLD